METLTLTAVVDPASRYHHPAHQIVFAVRGMPPQVPILAQSENKSKFLERLGISDDTVEGKRLYAMMKEEAIAGRARMSADPSSLLSQLVGDSSVKPPYSNTQISDSAMHRETLNIYRTARPETRAIYDLGHYTEGETEENWIIKWLLWHVFRYRDNRNRGRGVPSWVTRGSQVPDSPGNGSNPQPAATPATSPYGTAVSPLHTGQYYDQSYPRNSQIYSHRVEDDRARTSTSTQPQARVASLSSQYWDPVRDAQRSNNH